MSWLLDTSVYSQALRGKPVLPAVERWQSAGDANCQICEPVRAEVEWGLHLEDNRLRWDRYRRDVEDRLHCLPSDPPVWRRFAELKANQRRIGHPVTDLDLLIAATALQHDLTLATLNSRDFSRIEGLSWEDWSG